MIDLTPSSIATKLLPEDATAADRAIVEAMAERALAEVAKVASTPAAMMFGVERAMFRAAEAVRTMHFVRCERALKFIREWEADPDAPNDEDDESEAGQP